MPNINKQMQTILAWVTLGCLGYIINKLKDIMSVISEFAAKYKAHQQVQDQAIDGLVTDIKTLNDKITQLQNTAGAITPEDQALLDEIETGAKAVSDKLYALDAQTPPVPPTA